MEYTITKSLSLLKTLKARYDKEVRNLECIAVNMVLNSDAPILVISLKIL